jgi:hypothetical protein
MKEDFKCLGIFVFLWFVIISMFYAVSSASAQEIQYINQPPSFQLAEPMSPNASTVPRGATVTPVHVGDVARSPGVLYSIEANAWLLSEFERLQLFWIIEMNTRVNTVFTWAHHEISSRQNRHEAEQAIRQIELDARDRHIESLESINRDLVKATRRQIRRDRFKLVLTVAGVGIVAGVGGYFIGTVAR